MKQALSGARQEARGLPVEIVAVLTLLVLECVVVIITYSRLSEPLYHVSGSGFSRGLSRAVTFLNFPVALAAVAVLALCAGILARGWATAVGIVGIALSAVVFWPGVVDQADLDARPINALPALGVLAAASLAIAAAVTLRRVTPLGRRPADPLRIIVALVVLFIAIPWIAADLGFSFNGVPVLGTLFQSGEVRAQPGDPTLHPAVHHGHHHGWDGTLLVFTALLLSRVLPSLRRQRLRPLVGGYLALMLAYGFAEIANDAWLEQVVKRGWTDWEIPDVTSPTLSVAWAIIVLGAALVYMATAWLARRGGDGAVGAPVQGVP